MHGAAGERHGRREERGKRRQTSKQPLPDDIVHHATFPVRSAAVANPQGQFKQLSTKLLAVDLGAAQNRLHDLVGEQLIEAGLAAQAAIVKGIGRVAESRCHDQL